MGKGKAEQQSLTREQRVAEGLNEQGFLLAQVVRETIRGNVGGGQSQSTWRVMANEYPVTASDGSQTRIDLVLAAGPQWHLCVECKRPHPNFKEWILFDSEQTAESGGTCFIEAFNFSMSPVRLGAAQPEHRLLQKPAPPSLPVFNGYLEMAQKKDGRWSHTETMEEALRQVLRGHTGLMAKLMKTEFAGHYRSVPVVVTTAPLFEAVFDLAHVSLKTGEIAAEDINQLRPMEFCAVNYNGDDSLALRSEYAPISGTIVDGEVMRLHRRTIFIVQAEAISRFLDWMQTSFLAG